MKRRSAYRAAPSTAALLVGRSRQGPRATHPPDRERVAQALVRHVAAAGPSRVQLVALENLAQEVDVPGRELQSLDLTEFVRWEGGNDLTQRRESLVEGLCPLPLADVGHHALSL